MNNFGKLNTDYRMVYPEDTETNSHGEPSARDRGDDYYTEKSVICDCRLTEEEEDVARCYWCLLRADHAMSKCRARKGALCAKCAECVECTTCEKCKKPRKVTYC